MNSRFLDVAERELDHAFNWYNERGDEVGRHFLDELDRTIRRIKSFPLTSREVARGIRRYLMARFPYGVLYGIDDDSIIVMA